MIALICEGCKETLTNGTGRWIADDGNVEFYCSSCETDILQRAFKATPRPRAAKREAKPSPVEVDVARN